MAAGVLIALLMIAQQPGQTLPAVGLRPPAGPEAAAAEQRERHRLPTIVRICRQAVASGDLDAAIVRFADANGLSTWARLRLATDCRLYRQGLRDGGKR